jgi:DNA (cytosine-5)-methyltransferase 1
MRYIDLFAGLGGFHIALGKLGHQCVFASEIKENLIQLYESNFSIKPAGDIRAIKSKDIPAHDVLCAGFPCQPFSKAGLQKGLDDESNGDLFMQIVRILKYHKPSYFILENVQHLKKHDNEETYIHISSVLKKIGYDVRGEILSPHEYGIPQHRQRLFIIGSRFGLENFVWPAKRKLIDNAFSFIEASPVNTVILEKQKSHCLEIWQEFIDAIPTENKLPSFPIWSMEFGATYPFEEQTPFASTNTLLGRCNGNFGLSLKGMSRDEKFLNLPSYAKTQERNFPSWKRSYIRSNRAFYSTHKKKLSPIIKKIERLGIPSWQKFEWNIQGGERKIRNYIIQFRGSGIRLKRPDIFPSLVCVSTQIPIVGWEDRYITKWEGAKLQGMESLSHLPENNGSCFDALGNAVNAKLVELIAEQLLPVQNLNNQTPISLQLASV